jgi:hypothetical protein
MHALRFACYKSLAQAVNKVLIDDKGLLVVCTFGLPGCYHDDDTARAVNFSRDLVLNVQKVDLEGTGLVECSIGVASTILRSFFYVCVLPVACCLLRVACWLLLVACSVLLVA